MLNSRQLYWLKIKASLHTLFYIMLVTTSCEVLASEISITRIGPTLKHPWGLTTVGGQSVLVTTRSGSLYLINTSTQISKKIFNTPNVVEYRQGGLLDVTSQKIGDEIVVFLCYSKPVSSSESSTAVFRAILDGDRLVNGSDIFVSNKPSRSGVHFGCRLAIKDNILYASVGDRGERNNAQNPRNHSGTIIHISLPPARTPRSLNKNWAKEIYSIGHRNPQGLVFNDRTGELWSHEHGPRGGDEINIISYGNNYGWPKVSYGKEYIGGDIGLNYSPKGFTDPVWKWTPSIAPSGMAFYYGNMFPELRGKLLIGSLKFMRLFVVSMGKNGYPISETSILKNVVGRVRDVEVLKDGSILILNDEQEGGLFRISRVK
mgnify:FL=1